MIPTAYLHRVAKGQWLEECSVNLLHVDAVPEVDDPRWQQMDFHKLFL